MGAYPHFFTGGAWGVDLDVVGLMGQHSVYQEAMNYHNCWECPEPGSCEIGEVCECISTEEMRSADECVDIFALMGYMENITIQAQDKAGVTYSSYLAWSNWRDLVFFNDETDTVRLEITGEMADLLVPANDPLFFSLHAAVDRELYFYQWIWFQRQELETPEEEVDVFLGYRVGDPDYGDCSFMDQVLRSLWGPNFVRGEYGFVDRAEKDITNAEYWCSTLPYVPTVNNAHERDDCVLSEASWVYEVPSWVEDLIDNYDTSFISDLKQRGSLWRLTPEDELSRQLTSHVLKALPPAVRLFITN